MAPSAAKDVNILKDSIISNGKSSEKSNEATYKATIVWRNVINMSILHILAIWGWYQLLRGDGQLKTVGFNMFYMLLGGFGTTAGAHRLWAHRAYKAKAPLRVILALAQTVALQNDIYEWCRDHRVHHKFSETDGDPHNSNRGFFFAHMGWLMCKKHPDVKEKGKTVDMSDLWSDPIIRFQSQFYIPMVIIIWGLIPVYVPVYCWNESFQFSLGISMLRYVLALHNTWLVNSAAHFYGGQPYDKKIQPRENRFVTYLGIGEGYHNYHHTFPWDYSASEFGWQNNYNPTTALIDFFAWIGWAYDLKSPSNKVIDNRMQRTGDETSMKLTNFGYIYDVICGLGLFFFPLINAILVKLIYGIFN